MSLRYAFAGKEHMADGAAVGDPPRQESGCRSGVMSETAVADIANIFINELAVEVAEPSGHGQDRREYYF